MTDDVQGTATVVEIPPAERRGGRRALIIVVALVVGLATAGFGGVWWMQQRLDSLVDRIDDPFAQITSRPTAAEPTGDATPEAVPEPVTFLILGSDSRTSAGDPAQWERGAQRTDAIMVAQVSGDRQHVSVMSIPRDSWVNVPGHQDS